MIETCAYLVEQNSHLFRPDFAKWLTANYHVYAEFERSANSVWDSGFTHYSARTIMEVIRHRSNVKEITGEYKINNIRIPCCARLYALRYPNRKDLFSYRSNELRAVA